MKNWIRDNAKQLEMKHAVQALKGIVLTKPIHVICARALYSTVDLDIVYYFLLFHEMRLSPKYTQYPTVDLLSITDLA